MSVMRTTESPDERRRHIAEAVWRIVRRDGINAVSTRTVAAEAGMVLGSLRHYFPRQSDAVAFAMRLVMERATGRIRGIVAVAGPEGASGPELLEQFLPLDEERREEMEVWLVFAGAALADDALAPLKRDSDATMLAIIRRIVSAAAPADTPLDRVERVADRMRALTDGLAAHLVGRYPALTPASARAILADEYRGMWA
ncbi:hypothetical protein ASE16_17985 [Leifsonia sp. Root227]|nr:hypothetical protein ASE16_17985 [Leifsonia sp. Root227]